MVRDAGGLSQWLSRPGNEVIAPSIRKDSKLEVTMASAIDNSEFLMDCLSHMDQNVG